MAEYFPIDVSSFGSYSGSFSGSFFGNGSKLTGITASFFSGSVTSASYAATASYLLGSIASASYALTASYVNPLVQNVIITGSTYLTDSIYFSGSGAASRLVWNETDGTLDLGLKGGNVTLQIGQESVIQVVNKTGADLLEADYKAVRVRRVDEGGAQGQRLAIVLAQADNDANSVDTLGLVTEDIAVNQEGFITNSGLVRNIDTTGTLQGETWVDGDVLYLSPTISGSVTKVKPQAPQHTIVMGYVVYAHANNGKIFVKVDNGYELDELHNVRITTASLSSGDLLVYSSSVWINTRQLTGSYGITGSISVISGSIIGTASNALTASYVNPLVQNVIITGSTFISSSNATQLQVGSNLLFVSSSGRVGIRNTTPNSDLEIYGVGSGDGTLRLTRGNNNANYVALSGGTSGAIYNINTSGVQDHIFQTGGTERMRISGSGNVGIGTTTPIAKLHITGSTSEALLIVSSSSGPTLYVSGSGNVGIGTANPASVLSVVGRADISSRLRVGIAGNPNYTMEVWGDQIFATAAGAIWSIFQQSTERLGIGTSSPSSKLHVKGAGATSGTTALRVENTNASASLVVLDDGKVTIGRTDGAYVEVGTLSNFYNTSVGYNHVFRVGGTEVARVTGTGNILIGSTTDNARLYVSGAASSTLLKIDAPSANNIINVSGSGTVGIGNTGVLNTALAITANGAGGGNYIVQGYDSSAVNRFLVTATGRLQMTGTTDTGTSGTDERVRLTNTFNPTSGTREHMGIYLVQAISQSGGANGITRGLYIQPTLTAATDYRAIETTSGSILFSHGARTLLFASSSGNIGIGISTPVYPLSVAGSVSVYDTAGTNRRVFLGPTGVVGQLLIDNNGSWDVSLTGGSNKYIKDANLSLGTTSDLSARLGIRGSGATSATTALRVENTNTSASFVVRDNGSVGIGTTTPSVPLEVVGNMIISGGINQRGGAGVMFYDNTGYGGGKINGGYGYLNGEVYITPASGNTFIFSPNSGMSIGGFTIGGTAGSPPAYGLAVSGSIGVGTRTPITQLDVSGSGRFTGNLTVTGSLIATSFTGSLQGTASWATNVVSASGASTNVQYNSSGLLAGNNRFTFDGTTVRISGGSLIITGSSTISGSSIITGSLQVGVPGTNAAAIDTTTGTLSRGPVTTIDWVNRNLQDTSGVTSVDWETKALYDTSAVTSVDWENRILYTPNSLEAFNYSRTTDDLVSSQLYSSNIVSIDVQQNLVSNNLYAGQIISGSIDAGVTAYDIMYLDTDGTWKSLKNLPVVSTKMVGIEVDGNILLDGDMTVSDDGSVGTYVVSADHGLPVYISGTTGRLTTVVPGSDVIRIVGHIYYQDPVNTNVWLMKFRPSNDWA